MAAAMRLAATASSSVVSRERSSSASWNRCPYHCSVKPFQATFRRAELKEKATITARGA